MFDDKNLTPEQRRALQEADDHADKVYMDDPDLSAPRTEVRTTSVYKVPLNTFEEDVVVVKRGAEVECAHCRNYLDIISFGITSPYDLEHVDETFYWCPCGHKWFTEDKESGEEG